MTQHATNILEFEALILFVDHITGNVGMLKLT